MTTYPKITLKPGRDIHTRNKHPWIFRGALEKFPNAQDGDILAVHAADGTLLGHGYFTASQSIAGRMLNFSNQDPLESIKAHLLNAQALRTVCVPPNTYAFRLFNGEADGIPGLIVDSYAGVLVVQCNTQGVEKLKPLILRLLIDNLKPLAIFEKSTSPTRKQEGLDPAIGWLYESAPEPLHVLEHGLSFEVRLSHSQKTGAFLDQREVRQLVKEYANNRTVLNCFGYTGGFSVYALAGGALRADTLDVDSAALATAENSIAANGYGPGTHTAISEDAFNFLNRPLPHPYDFIILDPPAFAKRSSDVTNAARGYRELNRLALQHLPTNGLLLTASCSKHIDPALFRTIVFNAAKDAKREVQILSLHRMAADHPVSIYFPEGEYLKSLLVRVI